MKLLTIFGILLLLFMTGCETTKTDQKLSQLEMGMSLENFLKLFPYAMLVEHKIDTYENTGESFERRDYEYRFHSFLFADGKLNSYRNKLAR